MEQVAYALQLENGEFARLEFGEGAHAKVYSTEYLYMASMEWCLEEIEWYLEDFNQYMSLGTQGLFVKDGNMYQYHYESKITGIVKVKLSI